MRKELVTIGLAENGEGEDHKVEDKTEAVKNAQTGDEADEATFETKICFEENTDGQKVSCKVNNNTVVRYIVNMKDSGQLNFFQLQDHIDTLPHKYKFTDHF